MERRIKIKVATRKDGREFTVYKAVTKNGALMGAKFRKEVKNIPTEDSWVTIPDGGMNISRKDEYPKLWISAVTKVEPVALTFSRDNAAELMDVFG